VQARGGVHTLPRDEAAGEGGAPVVREQRGIVEKGAAGELGGESGDEEGGGGRERLGFLGSARGVELDAGGDPAEVLLHVAGRDAVLAAAGIEAGERGDGDGFDVGGAMGAEAVDEPGPAAVARRAEAVERGERERGVVLGKGVEPGAREPGGEQSVGAAAAVEQARERRVDGLRGGPGRPGLGGVFGEPGLRGGERRVEFAGGGGGVAERQRGEGGGRAVGERPEAVGALPADEGGAGAVDGGVRFAQNGFREDGLAAADGDQRGGLGAGGQRAGAEQRGDRRAGVGCVPMRCRGHGVRLSGGGARSPRRRSGWWRRCPGPRSPRG